ncbi:MAG: hypothetical protein KAX19_04860 [Candidatus Brocadiae bacterium]|nr:hypothetical protein [Candidatus Brocadiia bacterium]
MKKGWVVILVVVVIVVVIVVLATRGDKAPETTGPETTITKTEPPEGVEIPELTEEAKEKRDAGMAARDEGIKEAKRKAGAE